MLSAVEQAIEGAILNLDHQEIKKLLTKLPKGKRLRAKLILYIAKENKESIKLASIAEMIHAASLLHDDVIDDAMQRRGVESINALYGNKNAIMLGDILYSIGFFELVDMGSIIAKSISNAVVQLSIGELDDVSLSKQFNVDAVIYRDMIYKKTASLMEACAYSAAILAGKNADAYALYGKNLGIAFQMIDDLLDITSDAQTLGKPALHDFVEGKTTLPYIYLHNRLNNEDKKKLEAMHARSLDMKEQEWILLNIKKYDIIQKCYLEAKELVLEALEAIKDEKNQKLNSIAKEMIDRSF
ncbi:MAG: polyprenyl synthetase family protein [Campylobacterales bacterium]|nr:polyprenyl synthetase family protein [Campylobacterales bacterium]